MIMDLCMLLESLIIFEMFFSVSMIDLLYSTSYLFSRLLLR